VTVFGGTSAEHVNVTTYPFGNWKHWMTAAAEGLLVPFGPKPSQFVPSAPALIEFFITLSKALCARAPQSLMGLPCTTLRAPTTMSNDAKAVALISATLAVSVSPKTAARQRKNLLATSYLLSRSQACAFAGERRASLPNIASVIVLGIETSCDDTATAIVRDGRDVLASVSTNQDAFHAKYGGIVPEIASRQHVALLSAAVDDALGRAHMTFNDLSAIAVTRGPGLIGSLVVGVAAAKALAFALNKPLYAVNHLHGHIFAAFLDRKENPPYPFLALLVSGGHSQLVDVQSATNMRIIGRTRDDAAGEAYDKTARLLGLSYPGGPQLDALARSGNPKAFAFPRHRPDPGTLDLSFSGLKTSVRYFLESDEGRDANRADVAASFQAAVIDVLIARVDAAFSGGDYRAFVLSGGVAANSALQERVRTWSAARSVPALIPPPKYCTDNAAMIAAAAYRQREAVLADPLTLSADPNLPFELEYRSSVA